MVYLRNYLIQDIDLIFSHSNLYQDKALVQAGIMSEVQNVKPEFASFIDEILDKDVKTFYDLDYVIKALEELPGKKLAAAHCVFYAYTGAQLGSIKMRACVMVGTSCFIDVVPL